MKLCNGIDSCQHAPAEFDCTVLDHHATGKDIAAARAFCTQHAPVVLLANAAEHSLTSSAFLTVTKPTLGAALLYAVRAAIEARSITT